MSAFVFYTDVAGHVCGGTADTTSRSSETWKLKACPVRPLDECGVDIAWPNGERWTHDHIAGELPNTTQQEAA
ncbi:MAG: hypothetical protein EKK62_17020 [Acidimicrobiia bacterium]|nr:MAG: hypothetical protein EKK62_17020 [Acidimicrobiia bacterium]